VNSQASAMLSGCLTTTDTLSNAFWEESAAAVWAGAIAPALRMAAGDGCTAVLEVALTVPNEVGGIRLLVRGRFDPNPLSPTPPPAEVAAARAELSGAGVARKPCSRPVAST